MQAVMVAKKAIFSKEFLLALCVGAVLVVTVLGTLMGFFRDSAILTANRNAELVAVCAKNAIHEYLRTHDGEALRGKTFYGSDGVAEDGITLQLKGAPSGSFGFMLEENSTKIALCVWSDEVEVGAGDMVTFSVKEQISEYARGTLVGFWRAAKVEPNPQ